MINWLWTPPFSGYEKKITEVDQNCLFHKREICYDKASAFKKDGKLFSKNRGMVKAGIPPSISEETVRRLGRKTCLKWTYFQKKEIMSKNDLKLRVRFVQKCYRKRATCNYET